MLIEWLGFEKGTPQTAYQLVWHLQPCTLQHLCQSAHLSWNGSLQQHFPKVSPSPCGTKGEHNIAIPLMMINSSKNKK